jgi:hypothetical protein
MGFKMAFHFVSIALALMVLPLFFMVKDTEVVEKLEEEVIHRSKWEKIKEITGLVLDECKSHAKYPVCLFAFMINAPIIPLFSMTCILWVTSFINTGNVANDTDAK